MAGWFPELRSVRGEKRDWAAVPAEVLGFVARWLLIALLLYVCGGMAAGGQGDFSPAFRETSSALGSALFFLSLGYCLGTGHGAGLGDAVLPGAAGVRWNGPEGRLGRPVSVAAMTLFALAMAAGGFLLFRSMHWFPNFGIAPPGRAGQLVAVLCLCLGMVSFLPLVRRRRMDGAMALGISGLLSVMLGLSTLDGSLSIAVLNAVLELGDPVVCAVPLLMLAGRALEAGGLLPPPERDVSAYRGGSASSAPHFLPGRLLLELALEHMPSGNPFTSSARLRDRAGVLGECGYGLRARRLFLFCGGGMLLFLPPSLFLLFAGIFSGARMLPLFRMGALAALVFFVAGGALVPLLAGHGREAAAPGCTTSASVAGRPATRRYLCLGVASLLSLFFWTGGLVRLPESAGLTALCAMVAAVVFYGGVPFWTGASMADRALRDTSKALFPFMTVNLALMPLSVLGLIVAGTLSALPLPGAVLNVLFTVLALAACWLALRVMEPMTGAMLLVVLSSVGGAVFPTCLALALILLISHCCQGFAVDTEK